MPPHELCGLAVTRRGLAVALSSVGARWIWPCLFSILNPLSIGEPRILHATSQRQSRSTDHRYLLDLTSQSSVMAFECRYPDECVAGDYSCKSCVQSVVNFYFYFYFFYYLPFSLHDPWVAVVYVRGSSQFNNGFGCNGCACKPESRSPTRSKTLPQISIGIPWMS